MKVSTEYPEITKRHLEQAGVDADIRLSYGATEAKVPDIVDVVVDITETGRALRAAGLRIIETLVTSYTELIANPASFADPEKAHAMRQIHTLLQGVLDARGKVLVKMNVAAEALDEVIEIVPSLKSPTVNELFRGAGYAVETVVPKDEINILIPQLRDKGATDIVELPISKISLILGDVVSASAVLLVLAASFGHALWNARTHSGADRLGTLVVSYYVGALWLTPWIVLDPPFEVWWLLLTSGLLHASYITALAAAYDRGRSPSRTPSPRFCAARGGRARHLAARPGADALHCDWRGAGRDRTPDDRQRRVEHRSATGARTGAHDRCRHRRLHARRRTSGRGREWLGVLRHVVVPGRHVRDHRQSASDRAATPRSGRAFPSVLPRRRVMRSSCWPTPAPTQRTWRRSARPRSSSGLRWCRGHDPPARRRRGGHGRWRGAGDAVGQRRGSSPRRPPAA